MFGNNAIDGWFKYSRGERSSNFAYASLADVQNNVSSLGYPEDAIRYVKGMVEETIPTILPEQVSILRLDTDFYSSTKHALDYLYPLISTGGVSIFDDYGHFLGARKAVDEYMASLECKPMLSRLDYTGRLAIINGS